MKRLFLILVSLAFLFTQAFAQGPSRIAVMANTNGTLITPTNFFGSNVLAGDGITVSQGAGGKITIIGTVGASNAQPPSAVLTNLVNGNFAVTTNGRVLHVSATATGDGIMGRIDKPYALTNALASVLNGQVIVLAPEIYTNAHSMVWGLVSQPTFILSEKTNITIYGLGASIHSPTGKCVISIQSCSNIVLDGIEFTHDKTAANVQVMSNYVVLGHRWATLQVYDSAKVEFRNLTIRDSFQGGIYSDTYPGTTYATNGCVVDNCKFINNGMDTAAGELNYDLGGAAVRSSGGWKIQDSLFERCSLGVRVFPVIGLTDSRTNRTIGVDISGCRFIDCNYAGVMPRYTAVGTRILDNTFLRATNLSIPFMLNRDNGNAGIYADEDGWPNTGQIQGNTIVGGLYGISDRVPTVPAADLYATNMTIAGNTIQDTLWDAMRTQGSFFGLDVNNNAMHHPGYYGWLAVGNVFDSSFCDNRLTQFDAQKFGYGAVDFKLCDLASNVVIRGNLFEGADPYVGAGIILRDTNGGPVNCFNMVIGDNTFKQVLVPEKWGSSSNNVLRADTAYRWHTNNDNGDIMFWVLPEVDGTNGVVNHTNAIPNTNWVQARINASGGGDVYAASNNVFTGRNSFTNTVSASNFWDRSNVKWWGATGDGVTDDTVAVQAALNASRNVLVPPGNYLVGTLNLTNDQTVEMSGGATLRSLPAITWVFYATNSSNITVTGGAIIGTNDNTVDGIYVTGCSNVSIVGVRFQNCEHAVLIKSCQDVTVERINVTAGNTGIYASSSLPLCTGLSVFGNKISGCTNHGMNLYAVNASVGNNRVVGCGIVSNSLLHGIYAGLCNGTVAGNVVADQRGGAGFQIYSSDPTNLPSENVVVIGNTATNSEGHGIVLSGRNMLASGNIIRGWSTQAPGYYAFLLMGSNIVARGNHVSNQATNGGIVHLASGHFHVVENNTFCGDGSMANATIGDVKVAILRGNIASNLTDAALATLTTNLEVLELTDNSVYKGGSLIDGGNFVITNAVICGNHIFGATSAAFTYNFALPGNVTQFDNWRVTNGVADRLKDIIGGDMRLNGRLGVGGDSSSYSLEVKGETQISHTSPKLWLTRTNSTTASGMITFRGSDDVSDGTIAYNNYVGEGIEFLTGSNVRMYIESSSGNVGIGTNAPASALHVGNGGVLNVDGGIFVGGTNLHELAATGGSGNANTNANTVFGLNLTTLGNLVVWTDTFIRGLLYVTNDVYMYGDLYITSNLTVNTLTTETLDVTTNATFGTATITNRAIPVKKINGVGGANTNFTLLATEDLTYVDAGTTNVNILAIMGYSSTLAYRGSVVLTNRTATARTLSLGAITNNWINLQEFDGIAAPFTVTNSQAGRLSWEILGTNVQYSYKPMALPSN